MMNKEQNSNHLQVGKRCQRIDWIPQGLSVTIKYIGKDFLVTQNDEGIEGIWTNVDFIEWSLLPEPIESECCGKCDGINDKCISDQEVQLSINKSIELMIPKITETQRLAIVSPIEGTIVQMKGDGSYRAYMSKQWVEVSAEEIKEAFNKQ